MEAYQIALHNEDATAIAKLAQQYGKYNKLDKDDEKDRNYNEILNWCLLLTCLS